LPYTPPSLRVVYLEEESPIKSIVVDYYLGGFITSNIFCNRTEGTELYATFGNSAMAACT
jgi:hypothetical protein